MTTEKKVSKASFENKISDLENIVKKMEEGELSLEDSLKAFEKGVTLSRECQEQLEKSRVRVEELMSSQGKKQTKTKNFEEA